MKIIKKNKKAYFDYDIHKTYEAGIVLNGWEVKSLKNGAGDLEGSFVVVRDNEALLKNLRIKPWRYSPAVPAEKQTRDRKLLLHKSEILSLEQKRKAERYTIIPLEIFENDKGYVKVGIGLAKSKRKFDKRDKLKRKDLKRRVEQDRKSFKI